MASLWVSTITLKVAHLEADAFVACVSGYIGKALLCLDWENSDNDAWGSTVWARQFVDRVYAKTGITPLYTPILLDACR